MNIFEQYGIKEVADCTLYAIELDKYDDEIYVPILYFDTLKVSSIEQTAEQTSARGGLGNPELIIWDYGKEISVSLEDALYNPASQSMMWGAKFGTKNSKIYGVWNPYIYPKDRYGKNIYLKKDVWKVVEDSKMSLKFSVHGNNSTVYFTISTDDNTVTSITNDLPQIWEGSILYQTTSGGSGQISCGEKDGLVNVNFTMNLSNSSKRIISVDILVTDKKIIKINNIKLKQISELQEIIIDDYLYKNKDESDKKSEYELSNSGYIKAICPCDGLRIMVRYEVNNGQYKYLRYGVVTPTLDQIGDYTLKQGVLDPSLWKNNKIPERAEVVIDNYGDFNYKVYSYSNIVSWIDESMTILPKESASGTEEIYMNIKAKYNGQILEGHERVTVNVEQGKISKITGGNQAGRFHITLFGSKLQSDGYLEEFGSIELSISNTPMDDNKIIFEVVENNNNYEYDFNFSTKEYDEVELIENCPNSYEVYAYIWNKADLKMSSLEGEQDIYFLENASVKCHMQVDGSDKNITIARQQLYPSTYSYDDLTWLKDEDAKEISNESLESNNEKSYIWELSNYEPKIDFYQTIKVPITDISTGQEKDYTIRVKVGTFYIIKDWNVQTESPYEMIYPINSGLEDVPYLDRMEKCKATQTFAINTDNNLRMNMYSQMPQYEHSELTVYIEPKTMKPFEPNSDHFHRRNGSIIEGNLRIIKQHDIYYKWTRSKAPEYTTLGHRIIVDAKHFPGTYRLVGETYARSRSDGKDQRYQFEIPLCKMSSETSLTLEAAGDPTTFTMNLKVLRRDDGVMMKLTQYNVDCQKYDGQASGSTKVVPSDGVISTDPIIDDGSD